MNKKSDNELIQEFKAGSVFAFEILRKRYAEKLKIHIVHYFNHSEQEAEDIINEVFFRLYKKQFRGYHFNDMFSTYIYSATKNESISLKRTGWKKYFIRIENKHENKNYAEKNILENKELVEFLFTQITPKEHELVILKNFNYLSYKEISKITKVKETTLRSNHHRIMTKMKNIIKDKNLRIEDFT